MIDLEFLEKLIRTLDQSGLDHIEIERGGTRIRISRSPSPSSVIGGAPSPVGHPAAGAHVGHVSPVAHGGAIHGVATTSGGAATTDAGTAAPAGERLLEIKSPMVGTFYRAPTPDSEPFADVGTRISKGDPLCIIEAMKLMNELESEIEGTVREVCVSNGEPVEYGQVLFRVQPA